MASSKLMFFQLTMDGVVLQEVGEGVVLEQVVDADDLDALGGLCGAENEAADAAEAVDTDLESHGSG